MQVTAIKKNLETMVEGSSKSTLTPYLVVVGDTYPVVGLTMGPPGFYGLSGVFVYYYKADERTILPAPIELFTISVGTMHARWEVSSDNNNTITRLGPPELFEDPYFIEDLTDSEPEAVKKMYRILQILDI